MRGEAAARRRNTRHHITTFAAAHRSDDTSSPYTSGSIDLSPAQFHGMYVRNPIRNQYRRWMRIKSPYRKPY